MSHIYVISAFAENSLRALQRVVGVFARRRLTVEQINVFKTSRQGTSHFSIVIHSDERIISLVVRQLEKIIDLEEVRVSSSIARQNTVSIN